MISTMVDNAPSKWAFQLRILTSKKRHLLGSGDGFGTTDRLQSCQIDPIQVGILLTGRKGDASPCFDNHGSSFSIRAKSNNYYHKKLLFTLFQLPHHKSSIVHIFQAISLHPLPRVCLLLLTHFLPRACLPSGYRARVRDRFHAVRDSPRTSSLYQPSTSTDLLIHLWTAS